MTVIRRALTKRIQQAIIHVSATDRWRNALTFLHVKITNQCYKYYIFENQFFMEQYQGVSPSIGRRDSSRQGASNDGRFMSLALLDEKLFVFLLFFVFFKITRYLSI